MDKFEKASRIGLRFATSQGAFCADDLWHMPLTSTVGKANLDDLARGLHKQLKNGDDVSFVNPDKKSDETIQLRFDIVKHVIDVKLAEAEARRTQQANAEKKQQFLAIIAQKELEQIGGKSLEELRAAVAAM